ncbi:MAG: cysteine desulfurase [Clostridiales bacterium]|nr:cysteine desulfurase [Clostridiales bacterium]
MMDNDMIYLDNSATTRVFEQSAQRLQGALLRDYFNPASAYSEALAVEKEVEKARAFLAGLLFARPNEVIYTSGGTESNNMALTGYLKNLRGRRRVLVSSVEHPSVYEVLRAKEWQARHEIVFLPAKPDGGLDRQALTDALTEDVALVSCMHVNNELGTVTDLETLAALVRTKAPQAAIHSDGVQAFMKLPPAQLPVDFYSVSFHKLHAPKGVGALYAQKGVPFAGGQVGGGQEFALRAGTTNVPGILAADTALALYRENLAAWHDRLRACKTRLLDNLRSLPDVRINGPRPEDAAPHILNLSFLGVRGETMLHALAERGVLVATGAACSAHKAGKNRILTAIGLPPARQESALRFSFSPLNTPEEMDLAAEIITETVTELRRYKRR